MKNKIIFIGLLIMIIFIIGCTQKEGSKECSVNSDCVVFGKTGDCNCGCYNKDNLPSGAGGKCFCAAPTSCECINSKCENVFGEITSFDDCIKAGNPVMESYPSKCRAGERTFTEESCQKNGYILTLNTAKEIAVKSECGDNLKETYFCNENSGTWWIDLDIEKELCNPACVIDVETREASINWRCTGAILE